MLHWVSDSRLTWWTCLGEKSTLSLLFFVIEALFGLLSSLFLSPLTRFRESEESFLFGVEDSLQVVCFNKVHPPFLKLSCRLKFVERTSSLGFLPTELSHFRMAFWRPIWDKRILGFTNELFVRDKFSFCDVSIVFDSLLSPDCLNGGCRRLEHCPGDVLDDEGDGVMEAWERSLKVSAWLSRARLPFKDREHSFGVELLLKPMTFERRFDRLILKSWDWNDLSCWKLAIVKSKSWKSDQGYSPYRSGRCNWAGRWLALQTWTPGKYWLCYWILFPSLLDSHVATLSIVENVLKAI